jgi:hypothetical protein
MSRKTGAVHRAFLLKRHGFRWSFKQNGWEIDAYTCNRRQNRSSSYFIFMKPRRKPYRLFLSPTRKIVAKVNQTARAFENA